jgi:hypothetical protein
MCKHLLSKIDRKVVERTLQKDALKNDAAQRSRFLAGVVRLNPEISVLLFYLEALQGVADKREAAQAFALTVDRIDFDQVSNAQMSTVLDLITKTFEDHDRIQALFGLLESDSFARALDRALASGSAAPQIAEPFAPLRAVHKVVMQGEPVPKDEPALFERGLKAWLAAPDRVLRSYPVAVRARLAELLIAEVRGIEAPKSLLDSIPHGDPIYAKLGIARAEQLLAARNDDGARALLSQIAESHPDSTRVHRRLEALSWPRVGRVALKPVQEDGGRPAALARGFWLDASMFVWARIAAKEDAPRVLQEAQLQAGLLTPGVAHVLGFGTGDDGRAFVAIQPGGRPIDLKWIAKSSLEEALLLALEGTKILRALAALGIELPDARLERFLLERGGPYGLRIADLDRAVKADPSAAAITHGRLAVRFAQDVLRGEDGKLRQDAPPEIRARVRGAVPLPILAKLLAETSARLTV